TTAALVTVVEDYRQRSGAALLAVGHDRTLLERWCDRTVELAGAVGGRDGEEVRSAPRAPADTSAG
ncbi:ABC transporter ATP-binding protein, partial [Streptomyces sp. B15]|nr:ABC transporter ATP-binding protein [Streptomyces sp. B15]